MKIIKSEKVTWIDIMPPQKEDVEYLKENFLFHPFILKSVVPPIRHPRFENYGSYLFLVFHYPFYDKEKKETSPRELDILVTRDTIITIHYQTILPLHAFFVKLSLYEKQRQEFTDEGVGELLYRLLNEIVRSILPKLDRIDEKIEKIEENIFKGRQKETIAKISALKHDLIDFQRIIQPQARVFEGLKRASEEFFGRHFYPYFDELYNFFVTIKEILETHHQTLNELEETNSNLLSIRTNEIIKILTIFTVILAPLTLVASVFGMNVWLPLKENPNAFWFILSLMGILLALMIIYIKQKKWL